MSATGAEASAQASRLLTGHDVKVTFDSSQGRLDKYGRTLAYLWAADGQSFQWLMLHGGFASEYTYAAPYRYQRQFRAEQASARTAGRGLWAVGTCNGDLDKPAGPSTGLATSSSSGAPPSTVASGPGAGRCDPNYSPCVPLTGHDLDCSDVKGPIRVIGSDPNRFDGDGDGIGCQG